MADSKLDHLLERAVRDRALIGLSVAVVSGDRTVATAAAGFADAGSRTATPTDGACNWFSMTKIATATAAMMADEALDNTG